MPLKKIPNKKTIRIIGRVSPNTPSKNIFQQFPILIFYDNHILDISSWVKGNLASFP
jgi:hypothetical protein